MAFVYNIDGTSSRKCQCSHGNSKTWLNHWAYWANHHHGLAMPDKCQAKGCRNYVEVGAHVRDEDNLSIVWIIPFCQYHNKRPVTEPIELKTGAVLIGGSMTGDCA